VFSQDLLLVPLVTVGKQKVKWAEVAEQEINPQEYNQRANTSNREWAQEWDESKRVEEEEHVESVGKWEGEEGLHYWLPVTCACEDFWKQELWEGAPRANASIEV
jgi:hypothetical protein